MISDIVLAPKITAMLHSKSGTTVTRQITLTDGTTTARFEIENPELIEITSVEVDVILPVNTEEWLIVTLPDNTTKWVRSQDLEDQPK